ncbi:SET domain-containing protein SmydA-8-like isoform X1 [Colias croceus]|uniref:SET domain-containing protein SmydA-8-like isoform X1 n=1 Tax=Colias crocea TaxID=72248 RepID=UPI001E27CD04|nr:SET domain-containing protein SmydA-8-like isoform X1 [Colias croceus]
MLSMEQLSLTVKEHLDQIQISKFINHSNKWTIRQSDVSGRGLFATEDIRAGEVLFVDHPLVYGPRSGTIIQRGCTICGKIDSDTLFRCTKCGLVLCSQQCLSSDGHYDDCIQISAWSNKVSTEDVDENLLSRCLAAIRTLSLNEDKKQLLQSLQSHTLPQHGSEIRDLVKYFDISPEDEQLMTLAVCILDANAFQIATPYGSSEMSMRGLYPVSSLMNHNCVPNTKHSFNRDYYMVIKSVKAIPAGTELTTCYSGLLWGTPARRLHLFKTKHFWCKCERCADPTERGTFLGALKCFESSCTGSLLPVDPLKATSAWHCLSCELRVPNSNICAIQSALGSLLGSLDFENVGDLEKFVLNRLFKYVPKTNQIAVDLQCRIIWEFGEKDGFRWHELSEARLSLKESLCRSTLRTLAALGLGDAHLRGLLLYHLHASLAERARRCPELYEDLKIEIESTIEQAYHILQDDISSPPDLELRHQYLGPGCEKPHEERFLILDSSRPN